MVKVYYKCLFTQLAPLRIGTGSGEKTDHDLVKDSRGVPVIPGTSIAGVLRCLLSDSDATEVFGDVTTGEDPKSIPSKVLVSDAVLPLNLKEADYRISQRDGVGLSDNGTASSHAKYLFEVVECDQPYTAILELADDADSSRIVPLLEGALRQAQAVGLSFGARSTRGYGRVSVSVTKRTFSFPAQLDEWLCFDPLKDCISDPLPAGAVTENNRPIRIDLTLEMCDSFSVRVYTTAIVPTEEEAVPVQIALENKTGDAVIPGTSLAGCFRHHMRQLARGCGLGEPVCQQIDLLFGIADNEKKRSAISFSEAAVDTKKRITMTRNAIDRFTNATRNQGLFTTSVARGGKASVTILLPENTASVLCRLLAASINDLNQGLLTLGGEAGVGRGLCRVTQLTVNGAEKTSEMQALRTDYLLGGEG